MKDTEDWEIKHADDLTRTQIFVSTAASAAFAIIGANKLSDVIYRKILKKRKQKNRKKGY